MENFTAIKTNIYDDLLLHYQSNNLKWDDLAAHQQTILIGAYKRNFNIKDGELECSHFVIAKINKSLNKNSKTLKNDNFRQRLAM